jgi:hypothetical protein
VKLWRNVAVVERQTPEQLAEVSERNNLRVYPMAEGNKRSAELGAEAKRAATRRCD